MIRLARTATSLFVALALMGALTSCEQKDPCKETKEC